MSCKYKSVSRFCDIDSDTMWHTEHTAAVSSAVSEAHLALHQHGHIHEHIVQLTDAVLQFDDFTVPRLNLIHGLFTDVAVHDDLKQKLESKNEEVFQHNSALLAALQKAKTTSNAECSEKGIGRKFLSYKIRTFRPP